ncbi:MAG: type IV pilus modification protein PilV [Acinetobacter ursingii]|jgi:type IV pilus assembly protein PilV|uniref:Type IV pilus modification protein PilV n=2 Tax=Acinetobacter TaxID=469 RepID=N9C4Z2_9GAMM|nr:MULTISPECIES: type IV pilus modification protein PilV [Acinetobacter]ENV80551.1 type IV pilus modification protein PilV [Acinetobacter ursingii ANC 3649]MDU4392636.1 type IV pilus modification protein PilV [Acinetobacter ursingii]QXZ21862.1 type IV pilus modification protein PilV [Acinetobacter septicus]
MKYQKGVGLMEVIVAMLLLGVAVLGFALLQYKSLGMGEQALRKIEAVNIARNLSERMYFNRSGTYKGVSSTDTTKCLNAYCTANDFALKDIADVTQLAKNKNMTIAILSCPDTKNLRNCIYVAWDETKASQSNSDPAACTEADKFKYKSGARCVVVEAF